jgi:hypothetical protein
MTSTTTPHFVTLGMFIIDDFSFADEHGNPTGKVVDPQASFILLSLGHVPYLEHNFRLAEEELMQRSGREYGQYLLSQVVTRSYI